MDMPAFYGRFFTWYVKMGPRVYNVAILLDFTYKFKSVGILLCFPLVGVDCK